MTQEIQGAHVSEILRVSEEISGRNPEMHMNLLVRALILAAIEYRVPAEVVINNFKTMYAREPAKVMKELREGPLQ